MSLIPDRVAREPSGSAFVLQDGHTPRVALLTRFLHWLGPLEALSKEDQQALGVRSGGGKSLDAFDPDDPLSDEDLPEFEDDEDKTPVRPVDAGTQIAA
jgi:hypothetical protein